MYDASMFNLLKFKYLHKLFCYWCFFYVSENIYKERTLGRIKCNYIQHKKWKQLLIGHDTIKYSSNRKTYSLI